MLARMEQEAKRNGGFATFGAAGSPTSAAGSTGATLADTIVPNAPTSTGASTVGAPPTVITLPDVVAKTAVMFVLVVGMAVISWNLQINYAIIMIAFFGAFGLGLWASFSRTVRPALYLGYAALMGFALGGISLWYSTYATEMNGGKNSNIVYQAVLGTFAAFAAMLFLYSTRIIKVNSFFVRVMSIALLAYLGIAVFSLIAAIMGVGEGWGFYGVDGLGILLCSAGVALAAFSLALDFKAIETAIDVGLPEQESWRCAFGLVVTLVWLYLELLRLLAILNRS
ncbi:MAG TPA: Bax inhibitor-1/YccA family protein [Actinomycetes bacterium]|nr:Bax inhibitor-1/YccA family protein [Actinomycetes bacterium]